MKLGKGIPWTFPQNLCTNGKQMAKVLNIISHPLGLLIFSVNTFQSGWSLYSLVLVFEDEKYVAENGEKLDLLTHCWWRNEMVQLV
jgi:hypothetical protein